MPDYQTHITIGYITTGIFLYLNHFKFHWFEFNLIDYAIIAGICYLYSQLPDADQDVSRINKLVNSAAAIIIIYSFYKGLVLVGIISAVLILILEFVPHRGIMHSHIVGLISIIPLYLLNPAYAIVGALSFLSHKYLDGDFDL